MIENIQKIHEEVFNYLLKWSEGARQIKLLNPYFYMRNKRDERLKKGYWFPGDDSYLVISFWLGNDTMSRTPNVYFAITENGCHATIRAKDSVSKTLYFDKLATALNKNVSPYEKIIDPNPYWSKQYSNQIGDYIDFLNIFINNDKRIIDNYLMDNPTDEIDEFVSDFEFIDQNRFEKMLAKVLKEREEFNNNIRVNLDLEDKLPFAITKFNIENFQSIIKTNEENLPINAQWIFITGDNGYGKTSILRSIAIGLIKDPDLEKYIDKDNTNITIEYLFNGEINYIIRSKGSWTNSNQAINKRFINNEIEMYKYCLGYGPSRLNLQKYKNSLDHKNNVLSLFDNTFEMKNINDELIYSSLKSKIFITKLKDLINTVTNNKICDIQISEREVQFVEKLDDGSMTEPLPLEKIATGYRSIINLIFDIYFRYNNTGLWSDPSKFFGIVLIDE